MNRDLLLTALRVLAAVCEGEEVAPERIEEIRRLATAEDEGLELDELCTRIIRRELEFSPAVEES